MNKIRLRRSTYFVVNTILVFFLSFYILEKYDDNITEKLVSYTKEKMQNRVYDTFNNSINMIDKDTYDDLLIITYDKDGNIMHASYDMKKVYSMLGKISNDVMKKFDNNSFFITEKLGVYSNNILLRNLGTDIHVKADYINSIESSVSTSITNYGINSALLQLYINVRLEGKIIAPLKIENEVFEHSFLIDSKIINGKIPSYYSGSLDKNSSLFTVPIN